MADEATERLLWWLLASEIAVLLLLFAVLSASLLGLTPTASAFSRPLRVAALAFVAIELLIPAWVYYDLRRHADGPSMTWVHAAAMPVVNVFGLMGYLIERRRRLEE